MSHKGGLHYFVDYIFLWWINMEVINSAWSHGFEGGYDLENKDGGVCVCVWVSVFVCEKDRETEGRKETVACKREQDIVIYTF